MLVAEDWLTSCTRVLAEYIDTTLNDLDVEVESSFPSADKMEKWTPLPKAIVHINQDDLEHPVTGFGIQGTEVYVPAVGLVAGTWKLNEYQVHMVNYDIGVWVSAEMGGETKRMALVQRLADMFSYPGAKQAMKAATGGLWVESFSGGRNDVDRINDLPVWRAMDMTLIVRVVSRFVPTTTEVVPSDGFDQVQSLTIDGNLPV